MTTRDDEMANRKRSEETRAPHGDRSERAQDRPQPPMGGYQEGSIESVGGGPSGTDTDDRTAEGGPRPDVPRAAEREGHPDAFVSSEVARESADAPGRPERTRG